MLSSSIFASSVRACAPVRPAAALLRRQQQRCFAVRARKGATTHQPPPSNDDDDVQEPIRHSISIHQTNRTVDDIITHVEKGKLNLQPEYQRGLVWDRKMASHLVVAALEGRVVPPVFVEDRGAVKNIMDGKQRLCSLIAFVTGKSPVPGWEGAPVQLEIDEEQCHPWWDGKTFADLSDKWRIPLENYTLTFYEVHPDTPRDVVFKIYQEMNQGGVKHSNQQLRKAIYHGPYMDLLEELVKEPHFLKLQGREVPDDSREVDRELLLRLFSWLDNHHLDFRTPMFEWINAEVADNRAPPPGWLERRRQSFRNMLDVARQVWHLDVAFRSQTKTGKLRWGPDLWDTLGPALIRFLEQKGNSKQQLVAAGAQLRTRLEALLASKEWQDVKGCRSRKVVCARMELMEQLLRDCTVRPAGPRAFSAAIKQQLYDADPHCALCGGSIPAVDAAEVDHVVPWAKGGSTTLDNAQLVHRACNRHKGDRHLLSGGPSHDGHAAAAATREAAETRAASLANPG